MVWPSLSFYVSLSSLLVDDDIVNSKDPDIHPHFPNHPNSKQVEEGTYKAVGTCVEVEGRMSSYNYGSGHLPYWIPQLYDHNF